MAPQDPGGPIGGLVPVLLAVALLTGCSRPVAVPEPDPAPPGPIDDACRAFTDALPPELTTVGRRRDTSPRSPLTAAYGDPPVAIRCGVAPPAALAPTSLLVTVDGIDWFPEELTAGWLMTTVGRLAAIEITVPREHQPAPSVAAELGPAIHATVPPT